MAKFVIGCAVVAFCGFCGYALTWKYRARKSYFRQFFAFNRSFLSEISFARRPIEAWFHSASYEGEFDVTAKSFFTGVKNGDGKLQELCLPDCLNEDEKTFIFEYFSTLGRGDSAGQKGYFTLAEKTLSEKKETAEKECAKYCDLYVKLGILAGLAVLILLL